MATVIPTDQLRFSRTAALRGGEEIDASIFISYDEPGKGPGLHVHP